MSERMTPGTPEAQFPRATVIAWQAPALKLGLGATRELGYELGRLGVSSTLVVSDPTLAELGIPQRVADLAREGVEQVEVYDQAPVEPTDLAWRQALHDLAGREFDSFVGLGGGSSMDTAKFLNLMKTYPVDDLMRYVNKPVGDGAPVAGPVKPMIAIPTTAGTGSECTPSCVLDLVGKGFKTGISDPNLRPSVAIVDPLHTLSMPPAVTASTGYDVLCHACESYTTRPYDHRAPYASPAERPSYLGANPVSDVWCEKALELIGRYLRRAVLDPDDLEARTGMSQAATFAGMGFGNAGVHIPHSCAYPIAGMVTGYHPVDYPQAEPMVPHGQSVAVTAPAAFRFTYPTSPERHLRAAELLGADLRGVTDTNGREVLPETLLGLIKDTSGPDGLTDFGYTDEDIPAMVEGTLAQQRLLSGCPRHASRDALSAILHDSMTY
jgi:alcohol dehydrogenase class IV